MNERANLASRINTMHDTQTIAAIATAPGKGGIGIVRLSGSKALTIAQHITQIEYQPRYAHFCAFTVQIEGKPTQIDQGLSLYFKAPHSFTGEDVVELHAHGGPVVLQQLMQALVELGAVHAEPGEFSQRAYLNNKIDLTQAEAIADLINATTTASAQSAAKSLKGDFSTWVNQTSTAILKLRLYIEAAIDFPEEEIDFLSDQKVADALQLLRQTLNETLVKAQQGALLRDGMQLVIAGKPNAGKSSLMNQLAGKESAIVTDIEGTTRDILQETIHIDGMPLHIFDTAGLRDNPDTVEEIGIARARQALKEADLILVVIDSNDVANDIINQSQGLIAELALANDNLLLVYNKIDQVVLDTPQSVAGFPALFLSAKMGEGIDALRHQLAKSAGLQGNSHSVCSARQRHVVALKQTQRHLDAADALLHTSQAGELMAVELNWAHNALGDITGQVSSDDLLGEIFSSFCIGK